MERLNNTLPPRPEALSRARYLYEQFMAGAIPGPEQHEVHPSLAKGSRENVLYFTLPCALNFQRSSPALWRSALLTWEDPATQYVFQPERVVAEDVATIQTDLLKHRLAVQTNRHPRLWMDLCITVHKFYQDDPREFLRAYDFQVPRIVQALQGEKKHQFPYLGGQKLSNYWLYILSEFTNLPLQQTHEISIIPDTHVTKSTVALGLLGGSPSSQEVEAVWRSVLRELNVPPGDMHSALWRWSRNQFCPRVPTDHSGPERRPAR